MAIHLHEDGDDLPENHEINVTPFIDVMLVLLIIFMIAAPLATVDIPVELPDSSAAPAERPQEPVYLSIREDSSLYLDNQPLLLEGLAAALDRRTGNDRQTTVFLRGDKQVAYGQLMQVMDALRQAGYLKVGLVGLESVGTR
jgi:biopolymer transport protein ExbD